MLSSSVVIHVGFHKSASTYLQKVVIPQLPVNYIFLSGHRRHVLNLVEAPREDFSKEYFLKWIFDQMEKQDDANFSSTIISQEELSGHPHGYESINPFVTAENLKDSLPQAKIIIIVRNQFDYMLSLYAYRVAIKGRETRSLERFLQEEGKLGLYKKLEYEDLIAIPFK